MKNTLYWSVLVFACSIPVSSFVSTRALILTMVMTLLIKTPLTPLQMSKGAWDTIGYIAVLFFGLIYTEDFTTGIRVIETSFSIVAIIVVGSRFINFDRQFISRVFVSFLCGLLIACLICIVNSLLVFLEKGDIEVFTYYQLTGIINSHPTYLAYYLIAAITYSIYMIYYGLGGIGKKILVPLTVFFFGMLMLTGGRTAYISLLLVLSFFILKFMTDDMKVRKMSGFILTICLLIGLLGLSSMKYFDSELNINNDYWERSQLWYSAINANPNPLVGVGTGDYKTALNDYYLSHDLEAFAKDSYNSHNQFIQIYFSNGIVGLLVLVIMIARPLYLSVRSQNALGILLIFPFIIYGVTEVFLGRYQGVVFFALLHQIVIYQYNSSKYQFSLKAV